MAVGLLRPTVLLPAALLTKLTPGQLEAVLVHELVHLRRFDYAVNLVQTVLDAALFYHPVAGWLSRRVRHEREAACMFRVPYRGEMVSMCRVNAGGLRRATYDRLLQPTRPASHEEPSLT